MYLPFSLSSLRPALRVPCADITMLRADWELIVQDGRVEAASSQATSLIRVIHAPVLGACCSCRIVVPMPCCANCARSHRQQSKYWSVARPGFERVAWILYTDRTMEPGMDICIHKNKVVAESGRRGSQRHRGAGKGSAIISGRGRCLSRAAPLGRPVPNRIALSTSPSTPPSPTPSPKAAPP